MNDSEETMLSSTNSIDTNEYVIERLALLEDQVHTLQKELKKSKSELKTKSNSKSESESTQDEDENQNQNPKQQKRLSVSFSDTQTDITDVTNKSYELFDDDGEIYDEKSRRDKRDKDEDGVRYVSSEDEINMNARQPKSFKWENSFMTKRLNADDDYKSLSEDTFTMMIMARPGDTQWWYAFSIFSIQIALLSMILQDQYKYSYTTTPFDVPYKTSVVVHGGQLLAIILSLATQTDLVIAIITFIMLWKRRTMYWTKIASVAADSRTCTWVLRIAIPLGCKFVEGILVLLTTFVIVIQSDSMIELFKDFAAMQLISELDNMMFWLALHGYAGIRLMNGAKRVQKIRIKDDVIKSYCGIPLRTLVLVFLFFFMFSGWLYIVQGQESGDFFYMKYPHCDISEAQIKKMGDGICDGGQLNTIGCNFDDNDCLAFNIAYPGCKVVQTQLIGNGVCDQDYNLPECGFDGGDCCPVADHPRLGDGFCDGYIFNTAICGHDNGDCDEFNKGYPQCCGLQNYTMIELYNIFIRSEDHYHALGDGVCDGNYMYNIEKCGYDGGDCAACHETFKNEFELGKNEYFHEKFGDGECNGASPLNTEICGYDGGDCHNCMIEQSEIDLNFNASRLGDGICDGGAYMHESCYYDGGDCIDFVWDYPDCHVEEPARVGDGTCHNDLNTEECGFDGGDCEEYREKFKLVDCNVEDITRVGDGICDGGDYVKEACLYDGGDCDNCPGRIEYIGDGACDGAPYLNEECGYDGGDCDSCNTKEIERVGDGICDEQFNNQDCYYDGGDCLGNFGGDDFFGLGGGGDGDGDGDGEGDSVLVWGERDGGN